MKRFVWSAAATAVTLCLLLTASVPAGRAGEMPAKFKVGDTAPDFTLRNTEGQPVQLYKLTESKVVLLAFWSLRCNACLIEIPYLKQIHGAWAERGATVLSVVTDGMDADATRTFMEETGIAPSYPVLVDPEFSVLDVYTNFVVPLTLVIDRQGIIRYIHTGFEPGDEKQYEKALAGALGS